MGNVDIPHTTFTPAEPRLADAASPERPGMLAWDEDDRPAFDVHALWSAFYRNRYVVLALVVAGILLGVAASLVMPRIYQARASVQIEQQVAKVLGTEDTASVVNGEDFDRYIQTQVDVLSSRSMAERVATSLGLAANDDFLTKTNGGRPSSAAVGTRLDRVLDTLQKNMTVDLRRNSGVVGIIFTSRDPDLAAKVSNSFSANFIEGNIQRKFSTSAYSRKFLLEQLGLAKGRLEESERALIAYARSARLIDASAGAAKQGNTVEGPRSLVTANLVDLNTAYAESKANLARASQRWEQARATPVMSLPEVLSNDAVQRLSQKRAEDLAGLNELRVRLKPDHPSVVQAVASLESLDQQIRVLAQSIRGSIENQFLTAARQYRSLERQVAFLTNATFAEQDRTVRYNILQREVDTNRQLYESLLQRFKQVSAEAGVTTNNVTIVDTAEAPTRPTSPRPFLNLVLGGVLGIMLALLYAFAHEYLDDTVRNPQDVEVKLGLPLLGVVPEVRGVAPLAALANAKSEISEAYHSVRTSIELSSTTGVPHSILVTGGGKSEGKSTTSYALARDFASLGRRVLLIDADLRRPSLHRLLNLPRPDAGLSTVLAQLNTIQSAILPTATPHLAFLPGGLLPPDPAMLFSGMALSDLLSTLVGEYDVVILDGPPVLALADATQLASAVQATLFVIEAGGAHFGQARNAVVRLARAGANILGCVVTKYNAQKSGYGDSYNYYRYRYGDSVTTS